VFWIRSLYSLIERGCGSIWPISTLPSAKSPWTCSEGCDLYPSFGRRRLANLELILNNETHPIKTSLETSAIRITSLLDVRHLQSSDHELVLITSSIATPAWGLQKAYLLGQNGAGPSCQHPNHPHARKGRIKRGSVICSASFQNPF
jgi:hypothetical protein